MSLPTQASLAMDDDSPRVGDRVLVAGKNLVGTLRYLGPTEFKPGIWAGIELEEIGTGKNNGSVHDVTYFTCPDTTGIFVLASKIALISRAIENTPIVKKSFYSLPSKSTSFLKRRSQTKQRVASPPAEQLQLICDQQRQQILDLEQKILAMQLADDDKKKQIADAKAQLGWEQHRLYEVRKEKDQLQLQVQQWQQKSEQNVRNWDISKSHHRKEVAQLLEQQTQLIRELQTERSQVDQLKESLANLTQACQPLVLHKALSTPASTQSLQDQLEQLPDRVQRLADQAHQRFETERQQRRVIHDLRRDITHLETLIDTSVGKESDLLDSLDRERQYNKQLVHELKHVRQLIKPSSSDSEEDDLDPLPPYCEICELVGHDLMSCKQIDMLPTPETKSLDSPIMALSPIRSAMIPSL
ncbi:hypothetical protein DM01DRAFT_1337661 [Hesseltinella vesiculosa]|uniref:CAP-Gly domain-containing protein n=1 Tax=Hesseltinella vesiculosa TaxID=101127 RepID=A0A1X2GCB4_9FUNG|nr:hypothetical protein DM01DRAFT_1337661 [Hesseltinella vesiculosa]